jgi:NAD(P)-dependent dehydrogenase (short-subunit alcohol dehydrogenase family)
MDTAEIARLYDFTGRTILVTGGAGVLCSDWAVALAGCGANVVILGRNSAALQAVIDRFQPRQGAGRIFAVEGDVLKADALQAAVDKTLAEFGAIDGLINGAGGNRPDATTNPDKSFFDLPLDAIRWVFELNLIGTIMPSQIVGRHMAERKAGVILNVSSMNAFRPLTHIAAYSAAKAGVSNFTQWLATHMAQEYSGNIRVNAIAPGFFLGEQNRYLLVDKETGKLTQRGETIIGHTPLGRFGKPEDLLGPMLWLMSPASAFVTGIVVPVDGGFSAYSGV